MLDFWFYIIVYTKINVCSMNAAGVAATSATATVVVTVNKKTNWMCILYLDQIYYYSFESIEMKMCCWPICDQPQNYVWLKYFAVVAINSIIY